MNAILIITTLFMSGAFEGGASTVVTTSPMTTMEACNIAASKLSRDGALIPGKTEPGRFQFMPRGIYRVEAHCIAN